MQMSLAVEMKLEKTSLIAGEIASFTAYVDNVATYSDDTKVDITSKCLYFNINHVSHREQILKIDGSYVGFDTCEPETNISIMIGKSSYTAMVNSIEVNKSQVKEDGMDQFVVLDTFYVEKKIWWWLIVIAVFTIMTFILWRKKRKKHALNLTVKEKVLKKILNAANTDDIKELYSLVKMLEQNENRKYSLDNIAKQIFSPSFKQGQVDALRVKFQELIND